MIYLQYMDKTTKYFLDELKSIDLPVGDWAIICSGPMIPHGLKEHCHDIDIVARGAAWKKATKLGEVHEAAMGDNVVRLFNNTIEIFDGWKPGEWNIDELIDTAEMHLGFPWIKLEHVLKWKKIMGRVKDLKDIPIIEEYLTKQKK